MQNMIRRSLDLCLLSPRERTAIEYAARFRGDDAYADTVAAAAERTTWHITDTHGTRHGICYAAYIANGDLLEAAGMYWRFAGLGCGLGLDDYPKDEADEQVAFGLRMAQGWACIYSAKWAGWLAFCDELGLDAEQWMESMPGEFMRESMNEIGPTADEAAAVLLMEAKCEPSDRSLTAETFKKRLLGWVEEFEAVWA